MMMKKIIISLTFFISLIGSIYSQGNQNNEKIEAFKIAYFTQHLSLTSKEAKVFWPVYDSYTTEIEQIRKERRLLQRNVNQNLLSSDDNELKKLSDKYIALKRQEYEVSDKYHKKFKEVLPIRKVILLYKAEQSFKQELLKEIRKRRQANRPQNPGIRRRN